MARVLTTTSGLADVSVSHLKTLEKRFDKFIFVHVLLYWRAKV